MSEHPELVVAANRGDDTTNLRVADGGVDVCAAGARRQKLLALTSGRVDHRLQPERVTKPSESQLEDVVCLAGTAAGGCEYGDPVTGFQWWRREKVHTGMV